MPIGWKTKNRGKLTHPHEVEAWRGACAAQRLLTDTDPEDALANLED